MSKIKGVNGGTSDLTFPANCWGDADITAVSGGSQAIDSQKLKHQYPLTAIPFQAGSSVTSVTVFLGFVRAAAVLQAFEAMITGTIATGGDRTVTIDLQRAIAAGSYATLLTATVVLNSSTVLRTPTVAALTTTALNAGDALQVVITVAGAAGAQALGLACAAWIAENPF